MNWLKWLSCWFNKRHVFSYMQYPDGTSTRCCVRCGYKLED